MGAGLFVGQWIDGTTVWQSEDRVGIALVSMNGDLQMEIRT